MSILPKDRLISLYKKWEVDRKNSILKMLEHDVSAIGVDLGCGCGDFTLKVQENVGCSTFYGVDVWEKGLKESKKKGIRTLRMNLDYKLDFESCYFDVVVSDQVIEHLFYPQKFLNDILRILKVSGYAIISTENLSSWDNIFALLMGYKPFSMGFDNITIGNPFSPCNNYHDFKYPPHVRIFSYKSLISSLEYTGFKIEKIKGTGYIPCNLLANLDPRHARFITVKVRK